jgi:hypothetical protein
MLLDVGKKAIKTEISRDSIPSEVYDGTFT